MRVMAEESQEVTVGIGALKYSRSRGREIDLDLKRGINKTWPLLQCCK